jgi:hypothetical protein
MIVSAPEATARVSFSETWKSFEHFPGGVGFKHDFRGLNRVSFWDVH